MSADQIVGVGGEGGQNTEQRGLCVFVCTLSLSHSAPSTVLCYQVGEIQYRMAPATALPPYPPLFPILPSQQTPISSDPWMFGPFFQLFRSFQFQFLGFFVFPFTMFYQGKLQEHTKISWSVCAVVGKILRLNMIKQNSITGLFARKETLGTLSSGSLFKQKFSLRQYLEHQTLIRSAIFIFWERWIFWGNELCCNINLAFSEFLFAYFF